MSSQFIGVGKRKTAISRVICKKGSGKILINRRDYREYFFNTNYYCENILFPLVLTGKLNSYDIYINVHGSGISSQSDAIRYGIAKCILSEDPETRPILKKNGLLTRDTRIVERKKYGKAGARKSFQFSKR